MAWSKFILSAAIITFALSWAARYYPARPTAEASLAQQQMQHFDALPNQYSRTKRSVSDYTLLLHVMANHLSALYRRALRKTASDLIHERMMVEAQRLLNHSALAWPR